MDLYHYLKIRAKIEVKQHLYRFCFKLGTLPHPDGLLSGSVLHLTSVVLALILGEFAYNLAVFFQSGDHSSK